MEAYGLRMMEERVRERLHGKRRSFSDRHMNTHQLPREEIKDSQIDHTPAPESELHYRPPLNQLHLQIPW